MSASTYPLPERWSVTEQGLEEALAASATSHIPAEQRFIDNVSPVGAVVLKNGCPDFLVWYKNRVCLVEVKRGPDRRSPQQQLFAAVMESNGIPVFVSPDGNITKEIHDWFDSREVRRAKTDGTLRRILNRLFWSRTHPDQP